MQNDKRIWKSVNIANMDPNKSMSARWGHVCSILHPYLIFFGGYAGIFILC